jgi:hypothetical protein
MKQILKNSFYQLTGIYILAVLLISLNLFWKFTLHFEIFAVILAVLGISIIKKEKFNELKLNKRLHYTLLIIGVLLIIGFRVIPYIANSIPLGYDAGIYKFGIESSITDWSKGTFTPGFLYLTKFLNQIFSTQSILTWIFILFNLLLGTSIYFFCKEQFNKNVGIIAFLLYTVSIIQFKVFTFMYYKNIIALSTLLWSLYFFKREKRVWFILFGALTGILHRPTFYIFGLSYLFYTIVDYKNLKTNILNGISILVLTSIGYIGFFKQAVFPLFAPVLGSFIQTGTASGTFINFFTYQFSTLAYLPFAMIGFFSLVKKKKFNILFFWTLITTIIIYFKFFFFNRFIIHLDIALIILASLGFYIIIQNKKKFGILLLVVMLFSAGFVTLNESRNTSPLISQEQLNLIQQLKNTPENASVMAISSEYSPYIIAYSGRKTIAPGLFEENKWNKAQWNEFWETEDQEQTKELMNSYQKPIYLFAGAKDYNNPCFQTYLEQDNNKILEYIC